MKIAILYSHLKEFGGVERTVLKEAELLRSQGNEATCFFAYVDTTRFRNEFVNHKASRSYFNPSIPDNETLRLMLSLPLATSISKSFRGMDVLLCHGYGPSPWIGYNTKLAAGVEYISYIHSIPRFLYLEQEERRLWGQDSIRNKISISARVFRPLLKKIDHTGVINSRFVLANSEYTAKKIKEVYDCKALVCYPFVDVNLFKPILDEGLIRRVILEYKASRPLVLSTGRIVPIKRLEWLVEAMKHVIQHFPSATLMITGEISQDNTRYVRGLVEKAKSLGVIKNLRFSGFVSSAELLNLYNAASVYAHACPREAFGLSPVEAMACGTPAVVWDDGAGPCETVIDGKTGFMAKPYEIEDFAEKILKALAMDKSVLRGFATDHVRREFSCERHLKTLAEVLHGL